MRGPRTNTGRSEEGGKGGTGKGRGIPDKKGTRWEGTARGTIGRGAWEAVAWSGSTTAGPLKHHRSSWSSIGP